ncbi:ABC transporter permease [Tsukamurella sp. 8F]|uniref:ABC transporter permease n=1 Tax=unclassified Tsukamurella TaxID=2633480 RepID=UPI0023B9AF01|nr:MULTISPECIES: ABC transporter permease [unclassified Tsukamurella]MDF0528739.1 ABC transporter permease [Tsukamurella sp. 8J]MDF0589135.1 ABC transporter permease [Tsukamurella sp. 8F]
MRLLARRLWIGGLQLAALLVLTFVLTLLLPGDAADVQSGDVTTPAQRQETRMLLGLDVSPVDRFLRWCGSVLRGDLGISVSQGRPVWHVISGPLTVTAVMALAATVALVPVAGFAGLWAGLRPDGVADRVVTSVAIAVDSIPDFVLAIVLVSYLAVEGRLLPATTIGMSPEDVAADPRYLVLPLVVMVCRVAAPLVRLVRAGVVDTMRRPYITQARRLGVAPAELLLRHVAPNALGPAMQDLGRTGDSLLSGVLVVEAVFAMPGIATTLIDAIGARDAPVVLAVVLLTGIAAVLANTGIDALGARMVPQRVRA